MRVSIFLFSLPLKIMQIIVSLILSYRFVSIDYTGNTHISTYYKLWICATTVLRSRRLGITLSSSETHAAAVPVGA